MDNIIHRYTRPAIADKSWFFPVEERRFTVGELVERTKRYAAVLTMVGVEPGDRIGLINKTSSDFICLLYACWYLNAVAVPLRTAAGKFERFNDYLTRCDEVCGFRLFVIDDDLKDIPQVGHVGVLTISQLNGFAPSVVPEPVVLRADDMAVIQFSSGSTGRPKGVIVTHGMVMAQLQNLDELFTAPLAGAEISCYAVWAPLNHDMGLFVGALCPVYHGADNILASPTYFMRDPVRWFRLLAEHHVDVAMFTNASLAKSFLALEKRLAEQPLDLRRTRIYLGAEKVSPVVIREAYRVLAGSLGGKSNVYIGYGMAENGLGITTTRTGEIPVLRVRIDDAGRVKLAEADDSAAIELASIGVPYRNNEVTIRNDAGEVLPDLMLGEINVQSHCLTPGYFNDRQATEAVLRDERLRTGDLGFGYRGELYFFARKDDLIILNGLNIVPDDVEMAIEEMPFLRPSSTVLFAVDDAATGVPKLCLLAEIGGTLSEEEAKHRTVAISSHAFNELGMIINEIHLCEKGTIEKTSSGKKRRKVIKQRFVERRTELANGT